MDPLSISSGVAGLIGLALQVAPVLQSYVSNFRSAREDVQAYLDEVGALSQVLDRMYTFLDSSGMTSDQFQTTEAVLLQTIKSCEKSLLELIRMLRKPVGLTKKLLWHLEKEKIESIIARVRQCNQLFNFSLTVEGWALLSQTPAEVTTILQLQMQMSEKMHKMVEAASLSVESAKLYQDKTKELVSLLENVSIFAKAVGQLSEIQERVEEISCGIKDERHIEILDWLTRDQGPGRHHEIQGRRTPGTGRWIFAQCQFRQWLETETSTNILWCVGGPGSGKSTLMSFVIDEIKRSHTGSDAGVAYYYCDYRMRTSQPMVLVLGCMIKTFAEHLDSLPQSLNALYDKCRRENRQPVVSELEVIMNDICGLFKSLFVLIDALDEFSPADMTQTRHLVRLLDKLARNGARVFVTSRSRPEPLSAENNVVLEYTADSEDVRSHVLYVLRSDDMMMDLLDQQLEEEICNTIVSQAGGMFLLAVLHLQNIRDQVSRAGIRKSLEALSSDLGGAYDKSFDALSHQSAARKELALRALRWVACAYRPLSALELRHALAADDELWDWDKLSPLRLIISSCCGLLSVDGMEDHAQVRLVHHTLQQYLQSTQPDWYIRAHTVITQTCLQYLLLEALKAPEGQGEVKSKGILKRASNDISHPNMPAPRTPEKNNSDSSADEIFILVGYAKDCWGLHAALAPLEEYIDLAMRLFFDQSRLNFLFAENERIHGLHIASGFGLTKLVHYMAECGHDVECLDTGSQSPLHYACAHNHPDTALELIKLGANVSHVTPKRDTALFLAVGTGNLELVRVLLDNGAPPGQIARDGWIALHKAADMGFFEIVVLLVRRGSSVSSKSARRLTALHRAAGRGHIEIIKFLIKEQAPLEAVTHDLWTPLHGASSSGQTEAVELLLQHGANLYHQSLDGKTALHRACQGGHVETARALLQHGADVMIGDSKGNLPLHIAAREGHTAMVSCLLEHSTQQLLHLNKAKRTPLLESQWSGSRRTEELLMPRTHAISGSSVSDDADLPAAIHQDDPNAVNQLIKSRGLEIDSRDSIDRTLLQQALHAESFKVAQALLEAGADIHARSHIDDWQPIHFSALAGNAECVELCLKYGAQVNARTKSGQTPLHHACRKGDEDTVRLLIKNGCEIRATDSKYWQPLHTTADAGHEHIVRILLEHGALSRYNDLQWTTFQDFAALRGHHNLVELFRDLRYSRRPYGS